MSFLVSLPLEAGGRKKRKNCRHPASWRHFLNKTQQYNLSIHPSIPSTSSPMAAATNTIPPLGLPTRAPQIITTAITCSILSTLFVTLRLYTRSRINRAKLGWDDYLALLTLPFSISYSVLLCISTRHGMGLHAWEMTQEVRSDYQKWILIASSCGYLPSLLGYKMSILSLYVRIFDVNRRFRWATWGVMGVTAGYLFSNLWTQIFGCWPVEKYWRPDTPGHCIRTLEADYGYGSLNFITDLIIFILPLPMVWRLQLSRRDKVGLSVVFMIGSVSVACSTPSHD